MMLTRKNIQVSEPDENGLVTLMLKMGVKVEAGKVEQAKLMMMSSLYRDILAQAYRFCRFKMILNRIQAPETIELSAALEAWKDSLILAIEGEPAEAAIPAEPSK